jgi:hypothetical protein
VRVLKDNGIAMISGFEESGSNDRRHGVPEEEVLFVVISQFETLSKVAYSNIPSAVELVADKELNSFWYM